MPPIHTEPTMAEQVCTPGIRGTLFALKLDAAAAMKHRFFEILIPGACSKTLNPRPKP